MLNVTKRNLGSSTSSRRAFLKVSAVGAGALIVGVYMPIGKGLAADFRDPPMPNAFVRIDTDSSVTVLIKHLDKGQGIATGLSTIVAEELDADWAQMRAEFAPADAKIYNNLLFGPLQATGGSTSTANSWEQMRKAGAAARAMLVAAAADAWKVPAAEISVVRGILSHPSGRQGNFGEFAAKAATLPVPPEVSLKDTKDFRLIGSKLPRIDSVVKTTGRAIYSLDVRRPDMLTAVVLRAPLFGSVLKSVDSSPAKAVPGVVDVLVIPQGVAILAENTWAAIKGREALTTKWDDTKAEKRSTAEIYEEYRALAETPGASAVNRGDADAALRNAAKVVEAEFLFPYLAHAPMEPMNCTLEMKADGSCEMIAGSQFQTIEQSTIAAILGITPEKVSIKTIWAGGSFGRRANTSADYVAEAAQVLKASGGKRPIHVVWTREDDLRGGYYRPMFLHRVRAGLDGKADIIAWKHMLVGQSIMSGGPFESMMVKDGVDGTSVEGVSDMPYPVPNFSAQSHNARSPVPVLWWRSVGHSHTAQAVEVMIDELAVAAGKDPLAFRLAMLKDHPRHTAVLKLAAEKSGYGEKLPAGEGRGIAVHESFNSFVAMVIDVTVRGGDVKVDRIVAAVDCGIAVNPDVIRAQVEGGAGYALGAALRNKITLDKGSVEQTNFDGYEPLRISDMPKVEVHIVASSAPPTGIGEPGVPPVAPAVSNAIFAATGKRLRSLPFDFGDLKGA
jgi:isoquinoline 1-oxidoreductase subunit beta